MGQETASEVVIDGGGSEGAPKKEGFLRKDIEIHLSGSMGKKLHRDPQSPDRLRPDTAITALMKRALDELGWSSYETIYVPKQVSRVFSADEAEVLLAKCREIDGREPVYDPKAARRGFGR